MPEQRSFRYAIDKKHGTWSWLSRSKGEGLTRATCRIKVNGRWAGLAAAKAVQVRTRRLRGSTKTEVEADFGQVWRWHLSFTSVGRSPVLRIDTEIENLSGKTMRLGECRLMELARPAGRLEVSHSRDLTFFNYNDNFGDQRVKRIASDRGRHQSRYFCHLCEPESGRTFLASFETLDRQHTRHALIFRRGVGITSYIASCDFNGFLLAPGARIHTETLEVSFSGDPYRALETWADRLGRRYDPPMPDKALVGWCGFAWVDPWHTELYEDVVRRNAEAIRRRLPGHDIDTVWMSIGYLRDGLPGNWHEFNKESFPGGVRNTLDRLRKLGFKPGFWIAPFWAWKGTQAYRENRNNLLRTEEGTVWERDADGWPWAKKPVKRCVLDPTHPGTLRYLEKVFREYRRMGIRYYMIDFLTSGYLCPHKGLRVHDEQTAIVGPESYRRALKVIRRTVRPDTHLLSAVGLPVTHVGITNSTRMSQDYGEGRPVTSDARATYAMGDHGGCSYHRNQLCNMAAMWFTHRRLYLNNLNLLTIDKPVSRGEAEMIVTMFGLSGSPIMLGDDIAGMTEERLALVRKCLPAGSDTARPVDLFTSVYPDDVPKVLVLPVKTAWDRWWLVAVINIRDKALKQDLPLSDLGLRQGSRAWAFDFWNGSFEGTVRGSISIDVPPLSCRLLRFQRPKRHPWVLSTDMHVRQGEAELRDVQWDTERLLLRGKASRPDGETGSLYVIVPAGYRPRQYRGLHAAVDSRHGTMVLQKGLDFSRRSTSWQIAFKREGH